MKNYNKKFAWEIWCLCSIVFAFITNLMYFMEKNPSELYFWLSVGSIINLVICLLSGIKRDIKKKSKMY